MVAKRLVVLLMLVLISACATATERVPEEERFFDYALAICLGSAFKSEEVKTDFNRAANGIMEKSNISLDAYEEVRELVDLQLKKSYESKHGGQIQSLKCFDFRSEKNLEKIYRKYDPCKNPESWLEMDSFKSSCGN